MMMNNGSWWLTAWLANNTPEPCITKLDSSTWISNHGLTRWPRVYHLRLINHGEDNWRTATPVAGFWSMTSVPQRTMDSTRSDAMPFRQSRTLRWTPRQHRDQPWTVSERCWNGVAAPTQWHQRPGYAKDGSGTRWQRYPGKQGCINGASFHQATCG